MNLPSEMILACFDQCCEKYFTFYHDQKLKTFEILFSAEQWLPRFTQISVQTLLFSILYYDKYSFYIYFIRMDEKNRNGNKDDA